MAAVLRAEYASGATGAEREELALLASLRRFTDLSLGLIVLNPYNALRLPPPPLLPLLPLPRSAP